MPSQRWTLLDVDQGIATESFDRRETLTDPAKDRSASVRISKRRLSGGVSDGVDLVEIDNGRLSLSLLPTRGMGLWRGRCGDVELKWNSPNFGPVHPSFVPLTDPGGLGWLEGFDEWLVRCGLESNGSPEFDDKGVLRYPLHGRIANLPARSVELSIDRKTGEISLTGKVYETKLFFKKLELESTISTFPASSTFTVRDRVTNLSAHPGEFQLLYHINTGLPFAEPGSRFVIPFERMAPRSPEAAENLPTWDRLCPQTPGSGEVVFFFEPAANSDGVCKTLLASPKGDRALSLSFRPEEFPFFSFWKSRLSDADGYVCGIEPSVNLPNTRSFEKEHGRVVSLKPGESRVFTLEFEILHDAESVANAEKSIRQIGGAGVMDPTPRKEWTP